MNQKGLTFLEVVIASTILAGVTTTVFGIALTSERMQANEVSLRQSQMRLQIVLDQITGEIREGDQSLLRCVQFSESYFTSPQTLVAFPSGRAANSGFQVDPQNLKPAWTKLVLYAPYFDPQQNRSSLRRYEVAPVPAEFVDSEVTPFIQVTSTQIQLSGANPVSRSSGKRVLESVVKFTIDATKPIAFCEIELARAAMQTGARGRNGAQLVVSVAQPEGLTAQRIAADAEAAAVAAQQADAAAAAAAAAAAQTQADYDAWYYSPEQVAARAAQQAAYDAWWNALTPAEQQAYTDQWAADAAAAAAAAASAAAAVANTVQ